MRLIFLVTALAACLLNGACKSPSMRATDAPAASRGAFFNDGSDGDVRGRTENHFEGVAARPSEKAAFLDAIPGQQSRFDRTNEPADTPTPPTDRLVIYRAQLQVEVPRPEDALTECTAVLRDHGGFVASRHNTSVTCRVPAARFEDFLAAVRELGAVLDEQMTSSDVTDQHRDIRIRLENAKASRTRLLALLEKATDVEDILAIEKELQRLTEEIERATGQLAALDDKIAYSTVTVTFSAPAARGDAPRRPRPSDFQWMNALGVHKVYSW